MRKVLLIFTVLFMTTLVLAACGRDEPEPTAIPESTSTPEPVAVGDPAKGQELFATTCAACHGPAGKGVQGLGKDMTTSEFIAGLSDQELAEFVKKGRTPDDPLNTTGVLMPPKGGNPALTDEQLLNIIAYIRTIHN